MTSDQFKSAVLALFPSAVVNEFRAQVTDSNVFAVIHHHSNFQDIDKDKFKVDLYLEDRVNSRHTVSFSYTDENLATAWGEVNEQLEQWNLKTLSSVRKLTAKTTVGDISKFTAAVTKIFTSAEFGTPGLTAKVKLNDIKITIWQLPGHDSYMLLLEWNNLKIKTSNSSLPIAWQEAKANFNIEISKAQDSLEIS